VKAVEPEVFVSLPSALGPVTSVRSTLVQSSRATLIDRGLQHRYAALLCPEHRTRLDESLAPEWLPLELGLAHYAACDALGLSTAELQEIGEDVGLRLQGTFVGTLTRGARNVGLSPWVPLAQFTRLKERLMQGGGVMVRKTGPKDATVELHQIELFRHTYFRVAYAGVIASLLKLGAGKSVSVRVAGGSNFAQRCVYRCMWV
jgi:hypothetical protein